MVGYSMYFKINPEFKQLEDYLLSVPSRFEQEGKIVYSGRNTLKTLEYEGLTFCVKSFKKPHLLNKVVYSYFRKPKAERSFLYATCFMKQGIGTPKPVAYIVFKDFFGVTNTYYISLYQDCDFTFRGIAMLSEAEQIDAYKAFTRFTHDFHRKGVYFVDHSPGNTLVKKEDSGQWRFWLVDLNRTRFTPVSPEIGIKNLSMIELPNDKLEIIAGEYARLTQYDPDQMTRMLIDLTQKNNNRVHRKSWIRNTRRKIKHFLFP